MPYHAFPTPENAIQSLKSAKIQYGQVYLDCHRNRPGRRILILACQKDTVICQSLDTGFITAINREAINSDHPKFVYDCEFSQLVITTRPELLELDGRRYAQLLNRCINK